MYSINKVTHLESHDTTYPADSVEWCPIKDYHHVLVCGTYKLDEEKKIKTGSINLYTLENQITIKLVQCILDDAVLDLKWNYSLFSGKILLAAALSGNHITIYSLEMNTGLRLKVFTTFNTPATNNEPHMSLSIAWSKMNDSFNLAISDSHGFITLVNITNGTIYSFSAHNYESWIVAYDFWNSNLLYTGGDDSKFKCYDKRNNFEKPVFVNNEHSQGVTTCTSNMLRENVLTTGSYDENVRLWDTRNMKHSYKNTKVGGGVWRLKWESSTQEYLLSASMFNGAHIINTFNMSANICQSFGEKEKRLFYGADWCFLSIDTPDICEKKNSRIISMCSFYDHKLDLFLVN
ncbi:diphthine methyltransferase isoform X2 [Daktulosphaira vitifoliae]|uniref:diphthine methyltransferase isoform X2 n=1 Tax=Daktulosphaira vitifoliae TaxID=58002 RepID=UPI0021AAE6E6|nr:diphthine methyltransferase isoform X2 [Daktulosphaira vitifoliae]